MDSISWPSVLFYCIFAEFVFYQKLHAKNFHGASKGFELLLSLSVLGGMVTGIIYLIYYGWTVVWWAPIFIFFIGLLCTILGALVEVVIGRIALSLLGFIGWPISAWVMFTYIPN